MKNINDIKKYYKKNVYMTNYNIINMIIEKYKKICKLKHLVNLMSISNGELSLPLFSRNMDNLENTNFVNFICEYFFENMDETSITYYIEAINYANNNIMNDNKKKNFIEICKNIKFCLPHELIISIADRFKKIYFEEKYNEYKSYLDENKKYLNDAFNNNDRHGIILYQNWVSDAERKLDYLSDQSSYDFMYDILANIILNDNKYNPFQRFKYVYIDDKKYDSLRKGYILNICSKFLYPVRCKVIENCLYID